MQKNSRRSPTSRSGASIAGKWPPRSNSDQKHRFAGDGNVPMAKALIVCLTAGLIWQFVLVAVLVWREQRTLRWSTIREALWLRSPRSPRSGRVR